MNAFASVVRHLIVTVVVILLERLDFPTEELTDTAQAVADVSIVVLGGLATWFLVKYAPDIAKKIGVVMVLLFGLLLFPSCTVVRNPDGSWTATPDPHSVVVITTEAANQIVNSSK